jgi:hypothetical protein
MRCEGNHGTIGNYLEQHSLCLFKGTIAKLIKMFKCQITELIV